MSPVVAVGLSGGVDSAMAAQLLKSQGHELIGLTMQTWDGSVALGGQEGRSGCYGPGEAQDIAAASDVARRLGIPHHVVALAPEYRAEVLDYFTEEYRQGRTPNPCVRCNQKVKFGLLVERARRAGIRFDLFATGHYARLERREGRCLLKRAADRRKDQSYFLARLSQEQLRGLLLPLGELTKAQVKAEAARLGWRHLADKPESQDFIECRDYGVLFSKSDSRPGPILDLSGRRVGEHRGIIHYTVGQRKGVGLSGGGRPLHVVRIDACSNTVFVGPKEALYHRRVAIREVVWPALEAPPLGPLRADVQVRQQHRPAPALITPGVEPGTATALCDEPQLSVTPGQTAVFYQDDGVLGAGTIHSVE
ncbi:MAG TPA: tRNA 2-thiouridine(34) synthase MnmA [Elusimicrobia bacterium]|nr:tRNA 2-thiouridine(34) synthase MnmA [Elusimicrobiota bacterium]HBT61976.1 tRNA 2-thiouridine(34) synthase MnmA [Elusimicrobiota bacterium]